MTARSVYDSNGSVPVPEQLFFFFFLFCDFPVYFAICTCTLSKWCKEDGMERSSHQHSSITKRFKAQFDRREQILLATLKAKDVLQTRLKN
jgi:hypothetical protein